MDDRLEQLSVILDKASGRLSPRKDSGHHVENPDRRLVRMFPYFLAICILVWITSLVYLGDYSFSKIVEILCLSFVACFAILGVPCVFFIERGTFSNWVIFAYCLVMTGVMWLASLFTGDVYYALAIEDIVSALFGVDYMNDYVQFILGFLGTLAIMYFTTIGVITVVCGFIRHYIPNVLIAMEDHARKGVRGKAERFFLVPDIIDVKEIVLEPRECGHAFDLKMSLNIALYIFILGLLISSYLFVNPLLISVLGWQTMLAITFMLSMFMPALVLPWQIFRGLGAKVRSDAPRDYYLWTGAKKRLFSTFATLGVFMMMFVLSVYLGNSVTEIIYSYISFMIPLFITSLIYSTIYVNSFDAGVKKTIAERFEDGRSREDP